MKRFVEFYSYELGRRIKLPIDISLKSNKSTQTLLVEIPQQEYEVTIEPTYTNAIWEGGAE